MLTFRCLFPLFLSFSLAPFPFSAFRCSLRIYFILPSRAVSLVPQARLASVLVRRRVLMGSQSRATSASKQGNMGKTNPLKILLQSVARELRGQRSVPNALHSYFHSTAERQFQLRAQLHAPIRAEERERDREREREKETLASRQIDAVIKTYPFLDALHLEDPRARHVYRYAHRRDVFLLKAAPFGIALRRSISLCAVMLRLAMCRPNVQSTLVNDLIKARS